MNTKLVAFGAAVAVAGAFAIQPAAARDKLYISGSSTVFPFAQAVVEEFQNETNYEADLLSTGSGGGIKDHFCPGIGEDYADLTNASRAMKASEYELCQENGVEEIAEIQIGFDGLTLAVSREGADLDLTKNQVFQALAAQVPVDGELADNPYTKWSEIDSALPDVDIRVIVPPTTSGTYDAFVELVMVEGCEELSFYEGKDAEELCAALRSEPYVEFGSENDNETVADLEADATAVGIFGYSFLLENADIIKPVAVNGAEPTAETIESGEYEVTRPLFFYIKCAHRSVFPQMDDYVDEFTSEAAFGPDGYLVERGLITLSDARRAEEREQAMNCTPMEAPQS